MSILSPGELKASSKARLDLQMRALCVRVKESWHFQPHLQFTRLSKLAAFCLTVRLIPKWSSCMSLNLHGITRLTC